MSHSTYPPAKPRLTRPREGRMIAGVCAGLANYFNMDASLVRILFVVVTVFSLGIVGVVGYILAMLIMPEAPASYSSQYDDRQYNVDPPIGHDFNPPWATNTKADAYDPTPDWDFDADPARSPRTDPKRTDPNA